MSDLKEIFEKNYSPLCNYANAIIKDYNLSEDVVQRVFIQLWENKKLLNLDNPAPYLMKCVKFKCLDHLRSKKSHIEMSESELPDVESNSISELLEDDIEAVFAFLTAQLPPKTRKVFLMSRKSGMTYAEIANELDVSVKTVENQMGNALQKLRILLVKHHYLPSSIVFFSKIFNPN
ncbi:MAG: RNA polymerase sigma-70 factor [Bacteroidota bacterium]